ncbi:peptidoglycan-binding protein [Streptacidiphilus sp. PB12-B1b]|uniref:COG1470 family protein n=1 Tax=Streptacidiphilus sp. PB12-B1b TaxID=2705012 RepID=UPI0015FAB4FE|nr:peptidoglycan-binding protein [Streptacidiphilus sp. PB12-B1b]QMU77661.1 peptidoglycan-binding protein [Streptacidiphilus sp. PB12-B1b]
MSIWTSLEPASTTVDAGSSTTVTLRLRNTGDVVEEYRIVPVGDPALWVRVEPSTLKLFPGTTGSVELTFAPPRTPDATAGPNPYGVQVIPTEHPEATTVPEGNITVTPFTDVRAELLPSTCRGRFRGRSTLAVDNVGNVRLTASLSGRDTGSQLGFDIHPTSLQIEPGRAAFCAVRIKPERVRWSGQKETRPFKVAVQRSGAEPDLVSGSYLQLSVFPRWAFRVLSFAVMLVVLSVALWFAVHPSVQSKATALALADNNQPVTTPTQTAPLPDAPSMAPAAGQSPADPSATGGAAAPTPAGGSQGGGSGSGSGSGSGAGSGTSPAAQPTTTTLALPIQAGNQPNVLVEFAQYRLTTIGSTNPCRIGNGPGDLASVAVGVLDPTTVKQLTCFQNATDQHRYGRLRLAEPGELGRETLTALWSFSNLDSGTSALAAGQNSPHVYDADAALNWATHPQITQQVLSTGISQAEAYIRSFAPNGALPAESADSAFTSAVSSYSAAVTADDGNNLMKQGFGAGLVESPTVPGSGTVPSALWPPAPIQP